MEDDAPSSTITLLLLILNGRHRAKYLGLVHPGAGVVYRYYAVLPMGCSNSPIITGRAGRLGVEFPTENTCRRWTIANLAPHPVV